MTNRILVILTLLMPSALLADEGKSSPSMGVKIDAVPALFGVADIEFDIRVHRRLALAVALDGGLFYFVPAITHGNFKMGAVGGGGIGAKVSLTSSSFSDGWYLKPMVRFGYSGLVETENNLVVVPALGAGYDWFWSNGFWLSAGIDAHLPIAMSKIKEKDSRLLFNFPLPLASVGLGYAW